MLHGTIGFFFVPIAIYARLPDRQAELGLGAATATASGGRRSRPRPKTRFPPDRRTERFKEAFRDIVGGKPSEGLAAVGDEAVAATREAGAEVREQAERLTHAADQIGEKKTPGG